MALLHVCLRCGKLHYGRRRCRDCRKRAGTTVEQQQQGDSIDARSWTRIRRIVLMRDERCLHCGARDELIVQPLPGLRHSSNPADYATFCRPCDERAARTRAA